MGWFDDNSPYQNDWSPRDPATGQVLNGGFGQTPTNTTPGQPVAAVSGQANSSYVPPTGPNGTYTYADLQKINQTVFGGSLQDVSPWVGQKDAWQNLTSTPEGQAGLHHMGQAAPAAPTTGTSSGQLNWQDPSTWTKENINAYAASRGVTDPNFADYWLEKKDELFQHGQELGDPNYAFTRLSMADQFGGPRYGGDGASGTPGNQTFSYPDWTDTFSYADFKPPTGLTEENDPGYQQRLQLGIDTLQRSAAAKGTALDTGTLKDLTQYGQDFASNEFQNVYNRDAQTYLTNRNNAADIYNQRYGQYLQGYQNALNTFNTNFGVDTNLWNRALTEGNTGFARQLSLADLGLAATGSGAAAGSNYAGQAGGYLTGIGNAGAAGSVAGSNAWAGGLSNLANFGSSYPYLRSMNGSSGGGYQTPFFGY